MHSVLTPGSSGKWVLRASGNNVSFSIAFIFMCMSLHCVGACCSQGSGEVGSPRTGVMGACHSSWGHWKTNQKVFLTAELSLQPLGTAYDKWLVHSLALGFLFKDAVFHRYYWFTNVEFSLLERLVSPTSPGGSSQPFCAKGVTEQTLCPKHWHWKQ